MLGNELNRRGLGNQIPIVNLTNYRKEARFLPQLKQRVSARKYMKSHMYESEYDVNHTGEMHQNMNHGSKAFIANAARANHHQMVGSKAINSTARTEIRSEAGPRVDVTKNYSRLPKSHYDPQPNDYGQPVCDTIHRKAGKSGIAKGGIRYR